MRHCILFLWVAFLGACSSTPEMPPIVITPPAKGPSIENWLTYGNRSYLFTKSASISFLETTSTLPNLQIDTTTTFQSIDGFGYTLTGGSAMLINQKLSAADRGNLLRELFSTDGNGIGISYLRISIGASDLDEKVFTYDEVASGQTDVTLEKFSLQPDMVNLVPVLKELLAINPAVKIMGSPWTAPLWMKTNGQAKGGELKPEYYAVYAQYFVKYIQAMAAQGIPIEAVTLQNEPEHPGNTPSMTMTAAQQIDFVKNHLGPAFQSAGITTRIVVFDHNCDHPNYPITILNDAAAKSYIDGSAFHLYAGDISALTQVHNAHPDKNVYFTEQWTSGNGDFGGDLRWHVKNLIVGAPRNWAKVVLEWNLANDQNFEPHTPDGGCTLCQGAITINRASGTVARNVSYYIVAHASRLVRPGSVRIGSNVTDNLYSVAYKNPAGQKVLIVVNDNNTDMNFTIGFRNWKAPCSLPAGGVGTYVW